MGIIQVSVNPDTAEKILNLKIVIISSRMPALNRQRCVTITVITDKQIYSNRLSNNNPSTWNKRQEKTKITANIRFQIVNY